MKPYRPGKKQTSAIILQFRVTPEEEAVIRALAEYHRLTLSELLRRAVLEHHQLTERHTSTRSRTIDAA